MAEAAQIHALSDLMRELPSVRRARDYHLYDFRGNRYLDLYLSGGRALLGHRPDHLLLLVKNQMAKGLSGDFPSPLEGRLARALGQILPEHGIVRIYANMERLLAALAAWAGKHQPPVPLADPAIAPIGEGVLAALWRPFLPPQGVQPEILVPVLPFPAAFAPVVLCGRGDSARGLPPSDLVSPALLTGLVASVHALARLAERYGEAQWRVVDGPLWERRGPYLRARCEKEQYAGLFRRLLEVGIVINPQYPGPSIVPALFSGGEIKPLRALAGE